MITEEYRTSTVMNLVQQWAQEGFPGDWQVRPILADALEDAGFGQGPSDDRLTRRQRNLLNQLRGEDEVYRYDLSYFADLIVLPSLANGDWAEAFAFAGEPGAYNSAPANSPKAAVPRVPDVVDLKPFSRWDVKELFWSDEGENDGKNWVCYGQLKDGRFFFVSAGCDYTGWD